MPAKAGIQGYSSGKDAKNWIPAFAGKTEKERGRLQVDPNKFQGFRPRLV
jgi:hypothetical protein